MQHLLHFSDITVLAATTPFIIMPIEYTLKNQKQYAGCIVFCPFPQIYYSRYNDYSQEKNHGIH